MNPHQQPQNSPYNLQNKGYPQQTGPNIYPTLSPVQNPQYPPQQPQYPGYNAQTKPAGYQPPAQYGNVQARNDRNEERKEVESRIAELDQGFNTCFMNFYKTWLWLLAVLCLIAFIFDFIAYLNRTHFSIVEDYIVIYFLLMVWNVSQSIFGLKAISEKSLQKANVACVMMSIVLVPWICLEILMIYVVATDKHDGKYNWFAIEVFLLGMLTLINLIHIGLSMNGAFKVRKLLIERGILQEKLNEIDYSFRA